jgi:parallel beta-helix repeat protein
MIRLRKLRCAPFSVASLLLLFCAYVSSAYALYTPPASNPFITSSSETVTTLNISSGSISDAQTQLNSARAANASAVIVLNLTGTYTVTTQALTLPSKTCLVLKSHAVIQAASSITAPALIQVTSQSLVSIAGGTLNGNSKNIVGILVTTCDRVEIDDVSVQDCGQDGIRLTGHGNTTFDNEMTVTRCTVFGCDANGINASSATQFVAVDNNCFGNTGAGLLIGSAFSSVANNTCTGNGIGISVTGTRNNAITDNEIDNNSTGISLASTSASNWCTSNNFSGNTGVALVAAGSNDLIFDNTFSGNTSNLTASGTNNHIVARKGGLSASGQDYFYPPLIDDQHTNTTIVNGMGRTDVTIGSTTMSSVQSQYNSARSAHPSNVIVLHLNGTSYTGDATLNLSSDTCVILTGKITLNSGVTGFKIASAGSNHISVSGGTVDGQNTTGRSGVSFGGCQMVQVDGMTINNFGSDASAISGSDSIHFTGGTGSGAPYLVSRCTINGSAGRAIWSQINLQAVYTNNNCSNTRSGLDFDSHTQNALGKFNTFSNNDYSLFIEQSAQWCQGIGNFCGPGNTHGLIFINNAEDVPVQFNSAICNTCNGNNFGLRTAAVGNTSTGSPSTTVHNFLFGNQSFNNTGDGIQGDNTGTANAQNLYSQTNLGGNGTAIVTSGSEVFFNPTTPPVIPPTFSIVASAGSNGSISPSGTVVVDQGTSKTFTITPNSGFSVASVTVDGVNVGAVTSYTFTNVQANHVINATFATSGVTFTITASAGANGAISPSGPVTVNQGASQTFTITPNAGFAVSSVTVDGTNVGAVTTYTFSNVQANHTISASFATAPTTITSADGFFNRTLGSSQSGSFSVDFDASVSLSPSNTNFSLCQGNATAYTGLACMVRFNSTGTIDARNGGAFAAVTSMPFTANTTYHVRMDVNVASHTYNVAVTAPGGSPVTIATNYAFRTEQAAVTSLDTFDVNVNATPGGSATFGQTTVGTAPTTFTITASAGSGGTISPTGAVTVNQGASQTFTITPNSGFTVSSVTVDGTSVGAVSTYTFSNVQANHTVSATFAPVTFTITASAGANGSISPTGAVTVNQGSSQTFAITPNSGFAVSSVTVDGTSVGAVTTYTFSNVQANHTISAAFAPVTFTITASAGANGSISPTGAVTVNQGASQTFTITPNSGFSVSDVAVDGTSVGAVSTYTFSNVQANHTISATFVANSVTFTITASAGSGGTISPTGAVTVNQGSSQTFTITANSGFAISSVTVDGTNVGAVATYTFSNVQANHTISAAFSGTAPIEINDTDAGIVYTGTWSYSANRTHGEYQADVHFTATNGDSVSYTFNGTGISYITETYTDEGNVSFYIDGVFQQTVSCVSSTRVAQVAVFTVSGLAPGSHTLKAVKVDGTYMLIDALIYTSTSSPVAPPTFTPAGGTYSSAQTVTIGTTTTGATIRYTVDGSTPSETNGTIYTGPIVISSNTTLKAIAYKSGMTDSTVTSANYAFTVTVTVATGFYNQALPAAKTGTFTAQFDAVSSVSPANAVVSLSQGAAAAYTDMAVAVRFNTTGDIDARNGGAFAAASTIPFTAGTSYHFRLVIDVAAHTYSAFVTPAGGSEINIGTNYAFRTEQAGVTQLDTWNADVNATPGGSITVSNFVAQ